MRVPLTLGLFAVLASPAAAQVQSPPPKPAPAPAPVSGYGAWFGSVPDMDNSVGGIFLSGVTDGSPAQKAGLKQGDTILKMGGTEIPDLMAMTSLLRAKKPGDTIEVVFLRDNKEKKVPVILGVRPGS
jgi:S1-C subfamily serine protease